MTVEKERHVYIHDLYCNSGIRVLSVHQSYAEAASTANTLKLEKKTVTYDRGVRTTKFSTERSEWPQIRPTYLLITKALEVS